QSMNSNIASADGNRSLNLGIHNEVLRGALRNLNDAGQVAGNNNFRNSRYGASCRIIIFDLIAVGVTNRCNQLTAVGGCIDIAIIPAGDRQGCAYSSDVE